MVKCKYFLNVSFALCVDITLQQEIIIFGKSEDVKKCILSDLKYSDNISIVTRNLGAFIFDFAQCFFLRNYYIDGKLSAYHANNASFDYLLKLVDNVKKCNSCDDDTIAFLDFLDFTQFSLFNDSFIDAQRHLSLTENKKPNVEKMLEFLNKYLYRVVPDDDALEHIETDSYTFVVTDYNMYELIKHYLRILYQNNLYPRTCMRCGNHFISNTNIMPEVMCSDQCRREAQYERNKVYSAKNSTNYDTNYMKIYQKWYGKINRIKGKNILTEAELTIMTEMFDDFTNTSLQMKKDAKNGTISTDVFEQWLADFDNAMTAFFTQIKHK